MNIVYLIGNGFDIGLGLKTSYRDFIDSYRKQLTENENVAWMKSQMANHHQQWSDAEMAFGALNFSERGDSSVKVYDECYDDFTDAFINHLAKENDRFSIPREKCSSVADEFLRCALRLDWHMTEACASFYADRLQPQRELNLYFLTFNYTNTLEKILDFEVLGSKERNINAFNNDAQKVIVRDVCHVHGTLDEHYVFGIDNGTQIADKDVRTHCERNGGMIKAVSETKLGIANRRRGMSILDKADIIVLFGLSFGESDLGWWSRLYSRAFTGGVQTIICPYTDKIPTRLGAKLFTDLNRDAKLKIFHSLFNRYPNYADIVESTGANQLTVLQVKNVRDGRGRLNPCDYFRLESLSRFVRKDA